MSMPVCVLLVCQDSRLNLRSDANTYWVILVRSVVNFEKFYSKILHPFHKNALSSFALVKMVEWKSIQKELWDVIMTPRGEIL